MTRTFSALLLVTFWQAGCAQLAGLDETSGDGRTGVSLAFERVSIGSTVVKSPLDLTGRAATYLVPDDVEPSGLVRVDAVQSGLDTWTAEIFDATPAVQFDLPDFPTPNQRLWDYPNKTLLGGFNVLEHPNPTPVAPQSLLTVNVTLDVPYSTELLQLFTVGSWNVRNLEAPAVGALVVAPPAFQISTMTSLTGRPHEKLTTSDTLHVLRYLGNDLVGSVEIPPFDQTGNDTLTGTMTPVAHDRMLDIRINPTDAATRYSAARPTVPNLAFSWVLRAAPGFEQNNDSGPLLNALAVAPADTMVQVAYGNPFDAKGWKSTLTWATSATRTFTPPGQALPATLAASMTQRVVDPTAAQVLDLPAGLPELISIDGRSLSTDGMTLTAPTRAVEVTFIIDRASATLFQVQLFELVPNAGGTALQLQLVISASGIAPRFSLPPELFQVGKTYTLRAVSIDGGFPGVAEGDLRTRSLPIATSFLDSGVFQVVP